LTSRNAAHAARILIALIFLASGTAKLIPLEFEVVAFARWGYPMWFMTLTGVLEVAGGIGVLVPRLSVLSCFALSGLMLGALGTHLANAEWPMAVAATAILSLSAWSAWVRRDELRRLIPS
jgi:putative oxidoreductase